MTVIEATEYLGSNHVDWIMRHGKSDALEICAKRRTQHVREGHTDDVTAYDAISKFIEEFGSDEPRRIAVIG